MKKKLDCKKIIFQTETQSTNDDAWHYYDSTNKKNTEIFWSKIQKKGRGMHGNKWESAPGENLTFSILYPLSSTDWTDLHTLQQITSLSIYRTFEKVELEDIQIKWPNDLYVNGKKIAGILIESRSQGGQISACVIGIGINVFQQIFESPHATSLALENPDKQYTLREILETFCTFFNYFIDLYRDDPSSISTAYHQRLWLLGQWHPYLIIQTGEVKNLQLAAISTNGQAEMMDENNQKYYFNPKEIQLIL